MASCGNLVSTSPSRLSPSTCHGVTALALRAGRLSCAITPPTSPASICSSFRRWGSNCCTAGHPASGAATTRLDNVTANPTAEWIACQITEAFPWDEAPRDLIRDRDTSYGAAVTRRLRAMGIRDRPITPRSPWQNGHVERLIGSIRRECLDHVVVLGERHLRHLLANYAAYYNGVRTHLALDKDSPFHRPAQTLGRIASVTWLGGLHRHYVRMA